MPGMFRYHDGRNPTYYSRTPARQTRMNDVILSHDKIQMKITKVLWWEKRHWFVKPEIEAWCKENKIRISEVHSVETCIMVDFGDTRNEPSMWGDFSVHIRSKKKAALFKLFWA